MTQADDHMLLQETHDAVITLLSRCDQCHCRVSYLQTTIDGDGNEGLKTRVTVLEKYAKWVWVAITCIAALIGNAVISWFQIDRK